MKTHVCELIEIVPIEKPPEPPELLVDGRNAELVPVVDARMSEFRFVRLWLDKLRALLRNEPPELVNKTILALAKDVFRLVTTIEERTASGLRGGIVTCTLGSLRRRGLEARARAILGVDESAWADAPDNLEITCSLKAADKLGLLG